MNIVEVARTFVGITEEPENTFSDDTEFGKLIHAAGQKDGESWCAYTGEIIAKKALPNKFDEFDILFNAGAVRTFQNFKRKNYVTTSYAVVGYMVVWQKMIFNAVTGKTELHWQGHLGIVTVVHPDGSFDSVEGNTSKAGSRNGTTIRENKNHVIKTLVLSKENPSGLQVLGFVKLD